MGHQVLVCLFVALVGCSARNSNVCPTYEDYYTIRTNPKCWYDSAAELSAPELIKEAGYNFKEYKILSKDNYTTTMFRMSSPKVPQEKRKKNPIVAVHGILSSSSLYIAQKNRSLAFILADEGYDVWLINYRGSEYSEGHVTLSPSGDEFWDFGIDEMALLDLPEQLKVVLSETGNREKIFYIGYSLGSTIATAFATTYPHMARKLIKIFVFLGPANKLRHIRSPYASFASIADNILVTAKSKRLVAFVSRANPLQSILRHICMISPGLMKGCIKVASLLFGANHQMPPKLFPVYFHILPGGTSLRSLRQAADLVLNRFTKFDYGQKNYQIYGRKTPPRYDLSKIQVPIHMVYSTQDWVCGKTDTLAFFNSLPDHTKKYGIKEINVPNFSHLDFFLGEQAKELVYDGIVDLLRQIESE